MLYKNHKSKVLNADVKGIVTVQISAFGNRDAHGDVMGAKAYNKTLSEGFNRLKWFVNHGHDVYGAALVGVPVSYNITPQGVEITGQINTEKEMGRDILSDYLLYASHGKSLEHSVGIDVIKRDEKNNDVITELRLWEYSTLTTWGANPLTPLIDVKSATDADNIQVESYLDSLSQYAEMLTKSEFHAEKHVKNFIQKLENLYKLADLLKQQPETPTVVDAVTAAKSTVTKSYEAEYLYLFTKIKSI
jgi:HK97 family phage prohead protease